MMEEKGTRETISEKLSPFYSPPFFSLLVLLISFLFYGPPSGYPAAACNRTSSRFVILYELRKPLYGQPQLSPLFCSRAFRPNHFTNYQSEAELVFDELVVWYKQGRRGAVAPLEKQCWQVGPGLDGSG
jgi:hypothetical protein